MVWLTKVFYPVSAGIAFQNMAELNNGLLLSIGGEHTTSGNEVVLPDCYLYNPVTDAWTVTGSLNTARVNAVVIKLNNGKILVIGGRTLISDGDSLTSCELYDPNTGLWTITGSLNVGRYKPAVWKLSTGDVLVAGGLTGSPGFTPVASSEIYSVSGGTWSNPGHDLYQPGAEFYYFYLTDGTPIIAGGQYSTTGFNGTYSYNLSTGWNTVDAINPTGITASEEGYSCTLSNGDVLIAGVAGSIGGQLNLSQTTTMIFHQQSHTWEVVGNLNSRRQSAVVGALPNGAAFIAGGFVDPYAFVATGELYNPISKTWSNNAAYDLASQQTFATYIQTEKGVYTIGGWDISSYPAMVNAYPSVATNRFQSIPSGGSTSVANSDTSSYAIRWNEILQKLEYAAGLNWINTGLATSTGITQLHGDVTAGPGSGNQAATLATVNSNVGSFTSANITVNAKGLITAAANGSGGGFSPTPSVQVLTQTATSTTSTTYQVTALTHSFTLSNSAHKVKITVSGDMEAGSGNDYAFITIFRDGVDIVTSTPTAGRGIAEIYGGFGTPVLTTVSAAYLDAPGDTAAHTYDVRVKALSGAITASFPDGNCNSSMILEEVI